MSSSVTALRRPPRSPSAVLAETGALLWPALGAAVGTLAAPVRAAALSHFGWAGDGRYPASGKAIRPALVLLCSHGFGGDPADALAAAVAIELVHNATLIHDDIIDGDRTRRGRPALWTTAGPGPALLVGDALFFLAVQQLPRALAPLLTATVQELIAGEYDDVMFARRPSVGVAEVERMARAKTGSLFAAACRLGTLTAGASPAAVQDMAAFGEHIGQAFQLADDLLGIWGDPRRTGKPVGADIAARKKSLPAVYAMASGTEAGRVLARLYAGSEPLSPADVRLATTLMEHAGARAYCEQLLRSRAQMALDRLGTPALDPVTVAELEDVVRVLLDRDR